MPKLVNRPPKLRRHVRGQGIVSIGGKDHYCGKWKKGTRPPKAVLAMYKRIVAEYWEADVPPSQVDQNRITVLEVLDGFWRYAKKRYVKNGEPTSELGNVRDAVRSLKELYGEERAAAFGPVKLQALQSYLRKHSDLTRGTLNKRISRIKTIFKWAKNNELIPGPVYDAIKDVEGVRKGQTGMRESQPVLPVPDVVIQATLPCLPQTIADMVRVQRLTGCRPHEVCTLRPCDLDRSGDVWLYRPARHKTEHKDRERVILIGPKAQMILRPYLLRAEESYCFSPRESQKKQFAKRRETVKDSRDRRKKRGTYTAWNPFYDPNSYRMAVHRACVKAGVEKWSPNRLRHTAATEIREVFGSIDAAQVILGHSRLNVTEVYAEKNIAKAREIMKKIG
jgi:integrase